MSPHPNVPLEIEALVFDVIGTLVDEDVVFSTAATEIAATAGIVDPGSLRRSWASGLEAKMAAVVREEDAWRPHATLVAEAGREAVLEWGGELVPSVHRRLAAVDREYPAWPDVADGLRSLRADRLVVGLSNGDLGSLTRLAARNDLSWHAALSTSSAETFKPADAAYRLALDAFELDPARSLFVAAHPWDLRAAASHGFRTAYVARPGAERPVADDDFDYEVDSLTDLALVLSERPHATG